MRLFCREEPGQFVTDFIGHLRNLLLLRISPEGTEKLVEMSTEKKEELKRRQKIPTGNSHEVYSVFSELSNQIKFATAKRVLIEIALIKLMQPSMENNLIHYIIGWQTWKNRWKRRESYSGRVREKSRKKSPEKVAPKAPQAVSEEVKKLANEWGRVEQHLVGSLRAAVRTAKLSAKGEMFCLWFFLMRLCVYCFQRGKFVLPEGIDSKRNGQSRRGRNSVFRERKEFNEYFIDITEKINMPVIEEQEE
jgi:DNA polymerase-3 subunit gamma/tau